MLQKKVSATIQVTAVVDGENGPKGDNGDDGYGLSLTPTSLILESKLNDDQEVVNYVNNVVTVRVMKGSTPVQLTCSVLTETGSHSSNISISDSNIPVNNDAGTYSTVTLAGGINLSNGESGFFTVSVSSNDNKFSQNVRINFYVSRAATFTRQIKNGIEKAMGAQTEYSYDKLGKVIQTAYQADIQTSAKGLTQKFTEQVSRAGADGRNLFGFTKGVDFGTFQPFVQGYGIVSNVGSDGQAWIHHLGFEGKPGAYTVTFQARMLQQSRTLTFCLWGDGDVSVEQAVSTSWRNYELHFNITTYHNDTARTGQFYINDLNKNDAGVLQQDSNWNRIAIRHLKIERSTEATVFSEGDEDIAAIGQGDIIPEWDHNSMSHAPSVIINGATYPDYYYQTIDWNAGTSFWRLSNGGPSFSVKAGKIYTLSYWARSSNAGMVIRNHLWNQDTPQVGIIDVDIYGIYDAGAVDTIIESATSDGRTGVRLSTTWKQYFVRFYAAKDVSNMNCCACVIFRDDNEIRNSSGVVTGYRSGTIYFADVRLQEGYVMDASSFSSLIEQNARRISLVQQSGIKLAGIDIQNGTVNLFGDRVTFSNVDGTIKDKVWIDPDNGTIHAVDGEFSGNNNGFEIKLDGDKRLLAINGPIGVKGLNDMTPSDGAKTVEYLRLGQMHTIGAYYNNGGERYYFLYPSIVLRSYNSNIQGTSYRQITINGDGLTITQVQNGSPTKQWNFGPNASYLSNQLFITDYKSLPTSREATQSGGIYRDGETLKIRID